MFKLPTAKAFKRPTALGILINWPAHPTMFKKSAFKG
jgi:hypothetical protein